MRPGYPNWKLLAVVLAGLSTHAIAQQAPRFSAACSEAEILFSCTFADGRKTATVCRNEDSYFYSFGRTDEAPQLLLKRGVAELSYKPWNGVGHNIWEEVGFHNKSIDYLISYSNERTLDGGEQTVGSIAVMEGQEQLTLLVCDRGSVVADFSALAGDVKRDP